MTDAEILELAKQHGDMTIDNKRRIDYCFDDYGILVFVEVVANKTRDECAEKFEEMQSNGDAWVSTVAASAAIRSMTND